ncbi:MAG: ADP-ribosyltransferase domain-containing protein [Bdellovibrionota bacterium]
MSRSGNLGVFRATFDPPHEGQLEAIRQAVNRGNLQEILLITDDKGSTLSLADRQKLAEMVFSEIPEARFPEPALNERLAGKTYPELLDFLAERNERVTAIAYAKDEDGAIFSASKPNVNFAIAAQDTDSSAGLLRDIASARGLAGKTQGLKIESGASEKQARRFLFEGGTAPGLIPDSVSRFLSRAKNAPEPQLEVRHSLVTLHDDDPFRAHDQRAFRPSDRSAGGSQGGQWFQDESGKFYFGKSYDGDLDRMQVEKLASKIYNQLGVAAPDSFIREIEGKAYLLSPEAKGAAADAKVLAKTNLPDHFVIDAWLGNWDVVGRNFDNVIVDGENAVRIDNGGALFWKATGGEKPFGKAVDEIKAMRDPDHRSGEVFGSLSDSQVAGQIRAFMGSYANRRGAIEEIVGKSGLTSENQARILKSLDDRARWLATAGLRDLHPEAKSAKARLEQWTEELRGYQGNSLWKSNVEEARKRIQNAKITARLTDGEAVALSEYMGGDFNVINGSLRGTLKEGWSWVPASTRQSLQIAAYQAHIELTKSALSKLPDFKGHVQRVTRRNTSRYEVGKTFVEDGFLSTTDGGAAPYDGAVFFDILSKHGKNVSFLNPDNAEEEVLFPPGSRFKVISKEKDSDGNWHIRMNEI